MLLTVAPKAPLGPLGFSTLWQLKACYVSEPDTFTQFTFQIQRIYFSNFGESTCILISFERSNLCDGENEYN